MQEHQQNPVLARDPLKWNPVERNVARQMNVLDESNEAPYMQIGSIPRSSDAEAQCVVLVVEDDADQREILASSLSEAGFKVLEAESGEHALSVLRENEAAIDWLYTDIRLPGVVDGWRVADEFRFSHPVRPVVYASGYHSDRNRCVNGSVFLEKPVRPSRLIAIMRDLENLHFEEPIFFKSARP